MHCRMLMRAVGAMLLLILANSSSADARSRRNNPWAAIGGAAAGAIIFNELRKIKPGLAAPQRPGGRPSGPGPGAAQDDDDLDEDEILAVQKALAELGFDPGEPDGKMGRKTKAAIRDYQRSKSWKATGELTDEQLTALIGPLSGPGPGVGPSPGFDPGSPPAPGGRPPLHAGPGIGFTCTSDQAWRRVRESHRLHVQMLAGCENTASDEQVFVLTEPPPHVVRASVESIVKAMFTTPVVSVQERETQLGFDGWARDLVIVVRPQGGSGRQGLAGDLALLAEYVFGSAYKAHVEDISRMRPAPAWSAPEAVEITPDELHAWLIGPGAQPLASVSGGPAAPLLDRAKRGETGTFLSASPGLVVALLPAGPGSRLDNHLEALRQFVVDSDTYLGAIRLRSDRVALVGRERTTPLDAMPPLRLETVLLLASVEKANSELAQSYERNYPLAGKMLTDAGELFGWDWAPILLSDDLIDTEYGSLLNFTDNMLKGWSEAGKVRYKGFPHAAPDRFPFGETGASRLLSTDNLTFNWNTAGVGVLLRKDSLDVYAVRNTGSLPVSYFPEGSSDDPNAKAKLQQAEDTAYKRYFSTLRNPLLGRAVQYAALFQTFLAFDMRAAKPHDQAAGNARLAMVEKAMAPRIMDALRRLADPALQTNDDVLLNALYSKYGSDAPRHLNRVNLNPAALQEFRQGVSSVRAEIAGKIASLDLQLGDGWRQFFAEGRSAYAGRAFTSEQELQRVRRMLDALAPQRSHLQEGLALVVPISATREAVVAAGRRTTDGWIKTPMVVVSEHTGRSGVGGHNIGGRATRVEVSTGATRGAPQFTGDRASGYVIRVHPDDAPAAQALVRSFDREIGLNANAAARQRAVAAMETELRVAPAVVRPPRPVETALNISSAPRAERGAEIASQARLVGYRPRSQSEAAPRLQALAEAERAEIAIARVDEGYAVIRTAPRPPEVGHAPDLASLHRAVEEQLHLAAIGPPPVATPKIISDGSFTVKDMALFAETRAQAAQSLAGAGGKPPFGGNGMRIAMADEPGKGPAWWKRLIEKGGGGSGRPPRPGAGGPGNAFESRLGLVFGRSRPSEAVLSAKPRWAEARINVSFREPGELSFAHAPEMSGVYLHIVEMRVPVELGATGSRSVLSLDAIAGFRGKLGDGVVDRISQAVADFFKRAESATVRDAAERYKAYMIEQGADKINIRMRNEAADFVVGDNPAHGRSGTRG